MKQIQKDILVGCCLGDISFDVFHSTGKARFQMFHSLKQEDYLRHKYLIFEEYCKSSPKYRDGKYKGIFFNTVLSEEIYEFAKMFFNGNVRGVPQNIEDLLTPIGLAYWFCDDGTSCYAISKRVKNIKSFVKLCTDRYSENDVLRLIEVLKYKFNVNAKTFSPPSRKGTEIYIGLNDSVKFFDIIEPFIIPSLKYKVKRPYTKI